MKNNYSLAGLQLKMLLEKLFVLLFLLSISSLNFLNAQPVNIPVTGFNNDIVANGVGLSNTATSGTIPGVTYPSICVDGNLPTAFALLDQTYKWYSGSNAPACFLPASGAMPSALTAGLTYQLQSYSSLNALSVTSNTYTGSVLPTSGSVDLIAPASYANLYVLYESVLNTPSSPAITATVNFTDATTQAFTITTVNWFTASGVAYTPKFGRARNTPPNGPGGTEGCATGPYLFQMTLALNPANYTKQVQSISFNWNNAVGSASQSVNYLHVLAVGGMEPCVIPASQPTALTLTTISTSQINGNFTAAVPAPSNYLVVRYPNGAAVTDPVNGTNYTAGGTLGSGTIISVGSSTTFISTGLAGGTAYDYYVYSFNSTTCVGGPLYDTSIVPLQNSGTQSTNPCGTLSGTIPVGPTAPASPAGFTNLTSAFAYIVANGLGSHTILELQTDYTTAGETLPFVFNANPCISASRTLTIRPAAGVASPFIYSTASTAATFQFDGGSYITFDGRNGGTGSNKFIRIMNTTTAAASSGNAILLKNEASNNTFTYLDIQAANGNPSNNGNIVTTGAIPGAVAISTTTGPNGNDNNIFSFCDIHSVSSAGNMNVAFYAGNGTAAGTAANNDNNTITDCNIYDFFNPSSNSAGIDIGVGNNSYIITNNRLFHTNTKTFTSAVTHRFMWITPNNTGSVPVIGPYLITGNNIGGNTPAGGAPLSITTGTSATAFLGMDLSLGNNAASSVQNNTITNMNISCGNSTSSGFIGINVANGAVDVGTIAGNLVGSSTQLGSITYTATVTGGGMLGIRVGGGSTINIANNTVAGITIAGNTTSIATVFNGIAGSNGTNINIINNTIGSPTMANSINAVTASTVATVHAIRGIFVNGGANSTISGNLIANINTNNIATGGQASTVGGIYVSFSASTIINNTIRNISSAGQTTAGGGSSAMIGIAYTSSGLGIIRNNTISSLVLNNPTVTAGVVNQGIFFSTSGSGANIIEKNFIHSQAISNGANSAGTISGMDIASGNITISNNMIRLGINEQGLSILSPCVFRGISNNAGNSSIWHNSIYIGGTGVNNSAVPTYCFQRSGAVTTNVRNNIFQNERSNAALGGKHYSVFLNNTTNVTIGNNDYYGTGTGYVFATINGGTSDIAAYTPGWVAGDILSQVGDPQFINPTGDANNVNLHIHPTNATVIEQNGVNIASITEDFDDQSRAANTPDDIGADAGNFVGFFCTAGPASANTTIDNALSICGSGARTLSVNGFTPLPGFTYQWQESSTGLPGSFVNVSAGTGATTPNYTNTAITSTTWYQCEIGCLYGPGTAVSTPLQVTVLPAPLTVTPASGINVCSGANLDLTASGALSYSWSASPGATFSGGAVYLNPALFITAPANTPSVTSRPVAQLPQNNSTTTPQTMVNTPTWTYTVVATYANGCTRQAQVVANVITSPVVPVQLTYSTSPDPVCAPGTPVTMTVTNPGTVGAGSWIYDWYDQTGSNLLQSTTNTSSTDSYTAPAPVANGNNIYMVKVTNSLCPASYAIASPTYFVGYTSLNNISDANCGDNGTLNVYPEGQNSFTTWYSNSFSPGLLGPAFDASFGSTNFTGGRCNITPFATGQTGALLVRNPSAINTNNLRIDFKLSTAPRGFAFNIYGADGLCWSYAPDVVQGTVTGGGAAEGGSGTGLKIAFDATANTGSNVPGVYLMYNCTVPGQGPADAGVLAFKQGSFWQGLTDAPVSIIISQNGFVTMTINNQVIFDHVPLPAAYLTANKSNWLHAFTARTGGSDQLHAIDDLTIRYNSYEYSINSTNGTDGTWQTTNNFSGLAAGSYPVWVRNPTNPACFAFTGNIVIGTSPSPSAAITVAAPGFNTTICAGNSTTLTTNVVVPGAIFQWETSSSLAGPYIPAPGINDQANYETGPLTTNTFYRCIFTCPAASAVTSTPVQVTVNIGSILSTNSPQTLNCSGSPITLTATPGPNTVAVWYDAPTGGAPVFTGNSYTVSPSVLPTTYYIEPLTTVFTDHYDFGGEKNIGNLLGTVVAGTGITTRFNTTATMRIDSIKVLPTTTGTLTVSLQIAGTTTNVATQTFPITTTGSFINLAFSNFIVPSSGSFQITTSGVSCSYYSPYTGSYAASYMSLGGAMSIVGSATTPTGTTSSGVYGTAFNWSITTACPIGFGARIPVVVNPNPAYAVSISPATTYGLCANAIQQLDASSPNAYSNYSWSPITNLYSDPGATVPLTAGNNQATVYFKSPSAGTVSYTVSTAASGCTNTATTSITTIAAPNITATANPPALCAGGDVQLNVSQSIGSDANDYLFSSTFGSFNQISGGTSTSMSTSADDEISSAFNIGFTFDFCGIAYTTVQATSNGVLLFGSGKTGTLSNNLATTAATQRPGVAPLWDDLQCSSGVTYSVSGAPGFRVLTVQWLNMEWYYTANVPVVSFQVKLYEGSNTVQFVYRSEANAALSPSASAGIMGVNPTDFISLQDLTSAPGLSTTVSDNALNTKPATGQIYTFTPPVGGMLTYVWTGSNLTNNSISNPVAQNVQATETYSVLGTDPVTGCYTNVDVPVTVYPLPVPSAFSNSPICENQDILLFAFDGNSYSWTGPDNYSSSGSTGDAYVFGAQLNNSGNYTVEVTNSNGCTGTETIFVQVNDNPEPFVSLMNEVSCTGFSDGGFQIGVNGGTPFFSFNEFSLGQNFTGAYFGIPAGTYYVEVTDINQCISVAPLEVIVTSVPNAAPVISCPADITVNSTPGLCGAIVTYTAPVGSDVCPIIGTTQIAGLASGWTFPVGTTVNTFRVTDVEGVYTDCSFSVTVTETEAPTIVNCPASFSSCNPVTWTPPVITDNCPGVQITTSHTPGTFPAGVTTVTYTAIDVYNNTSTCSFDVTRLEESVAATGITSNRDFNNICIGESITLTINGGTLGDNAMWKWYTGSCGGTALPAFNGMTTITVSPTATTTYFARAEGTCNTTSCVSITVDVSTAGPPSGLAITSMPAFGATGVTGTITCTPVPGATFYRWTSILGHINAVWFGNPAAQGPVETAVPSVDVQFNQNLQNYQIRVVAGNACGRTNNASAHIRGTVPATTCLVGPALACPNTTATYSVATCEIPGTNGYQWTVGPDMTITTGQGTNTITVTFGAGFTNGQVCVNGVSQFGLGGPQTCLTVSNNTAAPGPISGNDEPCQSGLETYTIAAVPGASSYIWSTDINGAIAGGTTETGTVQFPAGPFSGNVCVQAVSGCGISTATCFSVTSGAAGNPGPILGSTTGICGATVNYALGTNDANSYNWILPAGVTLVSTNGANSVQVAFPSTPGQHVISVEAFYNCGSATSSITVDGAPGAPTVTPLTICAGSDETYIASATGADSYNWSTTGALYESCTNGNCSNFYVIWDVAGASFTVEAVNACGTSPSFTLNQNCRIAEGGEMETKVYPNPTTGQLTVEFTSERGGAYNLTVTDMAGRNIFNQDVTASSGMNTQRIDLENANPGMYMLYIRDAQGKISVTKVTKE